MMSIGTARCKLRAPMVMMEESASVALFTPSKMIAIECEKNPITSLKATRSILPTMPMMLALIIS